MNLRIAVLFLLLFQGAALLGQEREREEGMENEGEKAIEYHQEWEEKIQAFNRRNGIFNKNRAALNKKALVQSAGGIYRTSAYSVLNGGWTRVVQDESTKGTGRAECMAFHPTDPNTFYVGTAGGGLWKTINGGNTYTPITDNIPCGGIASIVVDQSNPNTVYILTGAGLSYQSNTSIGVLVSYDAGSTWHTTGLTDSVTNNSVPLVAYKLAMMPGNSNVLFACTNVGLYKTLNGGATWTIVLTGTAHSNRADICDVEFKPSSPTTVYASGFGNRFYMSAASGDATTWNLTANTSSSGAYPVPVLEFYYLMLAVTPAAPNSVYVASGIRTPDKDDPTLFFVKYETLSGVLRPKAAPVDVSCACANGPKTKDAFTAGGFRSGGGRLYGQVLADDDDSMNVLIGGVYFHATSNGGATWRIKNQLCTSPYTDYFHVDAANIYEDNNTTYVCTDGGVYKQAEDYSSSLSAWINLTRNIVNTQPYAIDGSPQDPELYLLGNQDNGVNVRSTFGTYQLFIGGDGTACKIVQSNKNLFFGTVQNGEYFRRSINGVTSDVRIADPSCNCPDSIPYSGYFDFSKCLELDENAANRLYAIKRDFYYSVDTGKTWIRRASGQTDAHKILRVAKSDYNLLYVVNGDGLLRRSNTFGASWVNRIMPFNDILISDLAIDKTNLNLIYITCMGNAGNKKMFKSTDGGATLGNWENLSSGLPNVDILTVEIDGVTGDVYAGTAIGIYVRPANENRWINFSNGLPVTQVRDLYINPTAQTISAGTFGRSIWKSSLYSSAACLSFRNFFTVFNEHYIGSAMDSLLTTSVIEGSTESNVKFTAQNGYVRLAPGFLAKESSSFKAAIEPCGAEPDLFRQSNKAVSKQKANDPLMVRSVAPIKAAKFRKKAYKHLDIKPAPVPKK